MAKEILIVDDSRTLRDMLTATLRAADYKVTEACDGIEALTEIEDKDFNLIITDINMPNMGGIELIDKLRQNDRYRATPILVLSTESDDDLKNIARRAGVTGWVVKPFVPEKLVRVVNKVCQ